MSDFLCVAPICRSSYMSEFIYEGIPTCSICRNSCTLDFLLLLMVLLTLMLMPPALAACSCSWHRFC